MHQTLATVSFLVHDYDEAILFFTESLSFQLLEDTPLESPDKRWVLVSPPKSNGIKLLLAKASTDQQKKSVGNQAGGRVFLFLNTDDFWRDYQQMSEHGIVFRELPRKEPYGTVAVFEDLYGNPWDLIQPASYTDS